jgi:hypothetical protein
MAIGYPVGRQSAASACTFMGNIYDGKTQAPDALFTVDPDILFCDLERLVAIRAGYP